MRLDRYLCESGHFSSRTKAAEAIKRGEVFVNGKVPKPSYEVDGSENFTFSDGAAKYVSLGAYKLEKAFSDFKLDVKGKVALDIGASTGGFTQVLLLNGVKKVYALDVGEGLLHPSVASDERVVPVENTNARYINSSFFGEKIDIIVSDVSFISLTCILPSVTDVLKEDGEAVLLIKPQFECGREALNKNGIVTSPHARYEACIKIIDAAANLSLGARAFSSVKETEGKNREYLVYLCKNQQGKVNANEIKDICSI